MSIIRTLFLGDIVGRPGRTAVKRILTDLKDKHGIDFVIANGENLAGGKGVTPETAEEVLNYGIDLLTSGNHIWEKKEVIDYIDKTTRLLRPANYPEGDPGKGFTFVELTVRDGNSFVVAVLNLLGRIFMPPTDNPFITAKKLIPLLRERTNTIIVDFHAEATGEKIAMGRFLDGQVSAVIGTHTHVQTADETIFPEGTAYITDVGMVGPIDSIIGIKKDFVIQRHLTDMPTRYEVAKGDVLVCALMFDINTDDGKAQSVQRLQIKVGEDQS